MIEITDAAPIQIIHALCLASTRFLLDVLIYDTTNFFNLLIVACNSAITYHTMVFRYLPAGVRHTARAR